MTVIKLSSSSSLPPKKLQAKMLLKDLSELKQDGKQYRNRGKREEKCVVGQDRA
jgi:hypothetical protein